MTLAEFFAQFDLELLLATGCPHERACHAERCESCS
jgi:ferredoxin